jgi:hypothetical protein
MSAQAVAVIRPAPSIISLPAFLCILSGKRQLHGSRAGKTKPSHGDVVGISDSGRYSTIARILGNPEVDTGGPEVGLWLHRQGVSPRLSER